MICKSSLPHPLYLISLSLSLSISPSGRLIQDSPADLCGKLYVYDELLCVNGKDVSKMDHSDIVALIKASGTTIKLVVQQPESKHVHTHTLMLGSFFKSVCLCG